MRMIQFYTRMHDKMHESKQATPGMYVSMYMIKRRACFQCYLKMQTQKLNFEAKERKRVTRVD